MKKIIISILIMGSVFLMSCNAPSNNSMVYIKPDSLISEELEPLAPHLDMKTGLFQLDYQGTKKDLRINLERYESGVFVETVTSIAFKGEGRGYEMPISLSVKDVIDDRYRVKLLAGGGMVEADLQLPSDEYFNVISIEDEKAFDDNETIILWVLKGIKNDEPLGIYNGDLEKNIETSATALVLSLNFE